MDNNYDNTPGAVPTLVPEQQEGTSTAPESTDTSMPEQAEKVVEPVPVAYTDPNVGRTGKQYSSNTNQQVDTGYNPNYHVEEDTRSLTMGDWILTLLALMIPCAGIILYFVWAFSKNVNVNRKKFCRAYLIVMGIGAVIGLVLGIIMSVTLATTTGGYY